MAEQISSEGALGLVITGEDASAGAFAAVNGSIGNLQQKTAALSVSTISHVRSMGMSFLHFGSSIIQGSVMGAITSLGHIIITTFRTMGMQVAIATGGLSVLAGVIATIILRARESKKDIEELYTEAQKRSDELRKLQIDVMTNETDQKKKKLAEERDARLKQVREMIDAEIAAEHKSGKVKEENTTKYYAVIRGINEKYAADVKAVDDSVTKNRLDNIKKRKDAEEKVANEIAKLKKEVASEEADIDKEMEAFGAAAQDKEDARKKGQMAVDTYHYNQRIKQGKALANAEEALKKKQQETFEIISFGFTSALSAANSYFQMKENKAVSEAQKFKQLSESSEGAQKTTYERLYALAKKEAKRQFAISQGVSLTQATLSGILAGVENFEKGSKIGGWPVGLIFAGVAAGITGLQIAAIKSTPAPAFQTSSSQERRVPGSSDQAMLGLLHGGENISRGGSSGVTFIIQGNIYNSEQTVRIMTDSIRKFRQRTGSVI